MSHLPPQQNLSAAFRVFQHVQRLLRGSGLGRLKFLRTFRDVVYNLVRPRQALTLDINGISLKVDPSQTGVVPELIRDGVFEKVETALVLSLLKPGLTVVDVGANIGYYTTLMARAIGPTGRVVAFEPEPTNFGFLSANVAANGFTNVVLEKKALSNRKSLSRLYLDPSNTGGHHLFDDGLHGESVQVDAVPLDLYWTGAPPRVDLIKMDIEGYEPVALEGMTATLQANPGVLVLTEFHPPMIHKAGRSPESYLQQLQALGFSFRLVNEITGEISNADVRGVFDYCDRNLYANLLCSRAPAP